MPKLDLKSSPEVSPTVAVAIIVIVLALVAIIYQLAVTPRGQAPDPRSMGPPGSPARSDAAISRDQEVCRAPAKSVHADRHRDGG